MIGHIENSCQFVVYCLATRAANVGFQFINQFTTRAANDCWIPDPGEDDYQLFEVECSSFVHEGYARGLGTMFPLHDVIFLK